MKPLFSVSFIGLCSILLSSCATAPVGSDSYIKGTKVGGAYIGEVEIWTSPTTLLAKGIFLAGFPDGTWTFWDSRGVKIVELEYANGVQNGTVQMWYGSFAYAGSAGKLNLKGYLREGVFDGSVVSYFPTGQERSERHYQKGVLQTCTVFGPDGNTLGEDESQINAERQNQSELAYLAALNVTIANAALYAKPLS